MRALAAAVGLSAPGLYRYVASRDELVGHMVDLVSADLEHPPPSGDWVHDITVVSERQRALFRAHPWLAEAVASLRFMGRHVLDHLDWGLAVLAGARPPRGGGAPAIQGPPRPRPPRRGLGGTGGRGGPAEPQDGGHRPRQRHRGTLLDDVPTGRSRGLRPTRPRTAPPPRGAPRRSGP